MNKGNVIIYEDLLRAHADPMLLRWAWNRDIRWIWSNLRRGDWMIAVALVVECPVAFIDRAASECVVPALRLAGEYRDDMRIELDIHTRWLEGKATAEDNRDAGRRAAIIASSAESLRGESLVELWATDSIARVFAGSFEMAVQVAAEAEGEAIQARWAANRARVRSLRDSADTIRRMVPAELIEAAAWDLV